eukprot:6040704-Prymnesium_polylepis.1
MSGPGGGAGGKGGIGDGHGTAGGRATVSIAATCTCGCARAASSTVCTTSGATIEVCGAASTVCCGGSVAPVCCSGSVAAMSASRKGCRRAEQDAACLAAAPRVLVAAAVADLHGLPRMSPSCPRPRRRRLQVAFAAVRRRGGALHLPHDAHARGRALREGEAEAQACAVRGV